MSDPNEFQEWIDKSLNGVTSEEESRALEQQLLSSQRARDHYLNCVNLHSALRRRFLAAQETESQLEPFPQVKRRTLFTGLAIAASTTLLAILAVSLWQKSTPSEPTAVVAHVVGAYRSPDLPLTEGEPVRPGLFELSRGLTRLDFQNGAQIVVQGPATMEIVDSTRIVLRIGVVTAVIPESAVGFQIDTSAAHVVDLGTSFGMAVDEEGQTNVCVFEGKVEVSPQSQDLSHFARLVHEGEAVRIHRNSNTLDSVVFETGPFESAWPISSGVLQATGSMRFVSPGPNFNPGNYPDNEHLVVFPERRGVELRTNIQVDLVDPGEYKRQSTSEKKTLSTGQRLTSYLLQFDAETPGSGPYGMRRMTGQITFSSKIAGIITTNPLLMKSEKIFKDSIVEYKVTRGIEPRPVGEEREGKDTMILTPDQSTLILDLYVADTKLDQIRVLVFAEEKKL